MKFRTIDVLDMLNVWYATSLVTLNKMGNPTRIKAITSPLRKRAALVQDVQSLKELREKARDLLRDRVEDDSVNREMLRSGLCCFLEVSDIAADILNQLLAE